MVEARLAALEQRLDEERRERLHALLMQEHRVLAAIGHVVRHWGDPVLRRAALGGAASALFFRGALVAVSGGTLALAAAGALLALQANHLLAVQNERMDVQTIMMEAQRQTQFFQTEVVAILAQVQQERQAQAAGSRAHATGPATASPPPGPPVLRRATFEPSDDLANRVALLSNLVTPFPRLLLEQTASPEQDWLKRNLQAVASALHRREAPMPRLEDPPLSLERGQLLFLLLNGGVDPEKLARHGATFRHANLSDRVMQGLSFTDLDLRGAHFTRSRLIAVDFLDTEFIEGARFDGADFGPFLNAPNLYHPSLARLPFLAVTRYPGAKLAGLLLMPGRGVPDSVEQDTSRPPPWPRGQPLPPGGRMPLPAALRHEVGEGAALPPEAAEWAVSWVRHDRFRWLLCLHPVATPGCMPPGGAP